MEGAQVSDDQDIRDDPRVQISMDGLRTIMDIWGVPLPRIMPIDGMSEENQHLVMDKILETMAVNAVVDDEARKMQKAVDKALADGTLFDEPADLQEEV
jgi:hypothetical protein